MLKKINGLIYILFILYIFLLPYLKFGIPVRGFMFAPSDFLLLSIIFFIACSIAANKFTFVFCGEFKKFLAVEMFFIVLVGLSGFNVTAIKPFILSFFPYIYAFFLTVAFGYAYTYYGNNLLLSIRRAILWTSLISMVPLVMYFCGVHIDMFFNEVSKNKYVFLCKNPNQYAVFLTTGLSIFLMISIIYRLNVKRGLIFAALIIVAILFTASRSVLLYGLFVIFFYIFYVYSLHIRIVKIEFSRFIRLLFFRAIISFLLVIFCLAGYAVLKKSVLNFPAAKKSFSGLTSIRDIKLNPRRLITMKEGIEVFSEHCIIGVGLGNFRPFYSSLEKEIHNTIISLLAETGLVGFTGYIFLIGFLIMKLIRSKINIIQSITFFGFLIGYFAINMTHYMLRERWIWLYFLVIIAIFDVTSRECIQNSDI